MATVGTEPVFYAADMARNTQDATIMMAANNGMPSLPAGFPDKLVSPLAWAGEDFKAADYVHVLTTEELAEINSALAHFRTLDINGELVKPECFPLPTLGPKLEAMSQDIYEGKGFGVIRGLNLGAYQVEDLTIVYLGIQSYIAEQRGRQDKQGNMLVHIVANSTAAEHHRHSTKSITFHNEEACDIVSWLTRSTASAGGKCIIASAYTVYNVLAASRPDLIRTLARSDWPFAIPRFQCRPIIFHEDSKLIMNFGRAPLLGNEAHPRPESLPSLDARQSEALDAIEAIAKATQLEIETQAGDMHFINNLAVLHRREGFVNGSADHEKRHLVRMWLRSSKHGWSIPAELRDEWDRAFKEDQSTENWRLEPMPAYFFPLRINPN